MKALTIICIMLAICMGLAAGTPRYYIQKVILDEGSIVDIVTNTGSTHNANYIIHADILETPGEVLGTDLGTPITSIRLYKTGNGTTVPYYASIFVQLGTFPTQWIAGNTIHMSVTYIPTGETSEWNLVIPAGTTTINYSGAGLEQIVPPFHTASINLSGQVSSPVFPLDGVNINIDQSTSVQTNSLGQFSCNVQPGNSYTITPQKDSYRFVPESYTYLDVTENIQNIDFDMFARYPQSASNPFPANNAEYVLPEQVELSWDCIPDSNYADPVSFVLYTPLGGNLLIPFVSGVTHYSHIVETLSYGTTYQWKVVPISADYTQNPNAIYWTFQTAIQAPQLVCSVAGLDFHEMEMGTNGSLSFAIQNLGYTALELYSFASTSARYTISCSSGPAPIVIAYGETASFTVQYSPNTAQQNNANIFITSNDPANTLKTIPLTGTGYQFTCEFSSTEPSGYLPWSVSFTPLQITNFHSYLWDFGDGTTSTLASPSHEYPNIGYYSVTLSMTDFWQTKVYQLQNYILVLGHTYVEADSSPISFDEVYLGENSDLQNIVLHNTGQYSVIIQSIAFTSGEFTSTLPEPYPEIVPGDSLLIPIVFHPSTAGIKHAVLSITNNSENNPTIDVNISGIGLYVPPAVPENVNIAMQDGSAVIDWEAVTTNILGQPLTPDFYLVFFNGSGVMQDDRFYFLAIAPSLTHTHQSVGLYSANMYYRIKAIKSYRSDAILQNLNELQRQKKNLTEREVSDLIRQVEKGNL